MKSVNNQIACKPFKKTSVQTHTQKGFLTISQKTDLTALEVVFGNTPSANSAYVVVPGDVIFVRGDQCASPWAKQVLRVPLDSAETPEYEEVILVPNDQVLFVLNCADELDGCSTDDCCGNCCGV